MVPAPLPTVCLAPTGVGGRARARFEVLAGAGARAGLGMVIALAGCAAATDASGWRHAKVVQIVPAGGAAPAADARCLAGPDGQAASGATGTIAVVRYRVTRAHYRQAFHLPPDMAPAVGDTVMVRPDACQMRPMGDRHAASAVTP